VTERYTPTITCDPSRLFGEPCITGTRISAENIAETVWVGDTVDDVAGDYDIKREDVLWCCAWWTLKGPVAKYIGHKRERKRDPRWDVWRRWAMEAQRSFGGHTSWPVCDPDGFTDL
jgi:uncharacterized protein (DUF433 family)